MKKVLLIAAIAVFGISTATAQISFGAKAGANFAGVVGDDADDLDGLTSFHVGGVVNIGINEWLAIQPEVVYSAQGFSIDDEIDVEQKVSYINVPIMADFKIAEGLSLQGGPQVGIKAGSKFEVDGDEIDEDDDGIESLDVAAGIGAQYKLPLGLFFQARYATSLTNLVENEDFDVKNSVVSVSVGWFFN